MRWPFSKQARSATPSPHDTALPVHNDVDTHFGAMVDRNLAGIHLERSGAIDRAIVLYEANVAESFIGSHPYERLRILYTKQHDYANALRVCRAYLALPLRDVDAEKGVRLRQHATKLAAKIAEGRK